MGNTITITIKRLMAQAGTRKIAVELSSIGYDFDYEVADLSGMGKAASVSKSGRFKRIGAAVHNA